MEPEPWRAAGPCLAVLHRQVTVRYRAREESIKSTIDALVIKLSVGSQWDYQRRLRVALDLLHTLWVLDQDAWRQVMVQYVGVAMSASVVSAAPGTVAPLTVVFQVQYEYDKYSNTHVHIARWEKMLYATVRLTDAEASIKRNLIHAYRSRTACDMWMRAIPIHLRLVLALGTAAIESYMTNVAHMVEVVRDNLRAAPSDHPHPLETCTPFMLDALQFNAYACTLTSRLTRQVIQLYALGVRFHYLSVTITSHEANVCKDSDDQQEDDNTDRNRLVPVLLSPGPAEEHDSAAESRVPIETLAIHCADLVQFHAACTALESTRKVKTLELHNVFASPWQADRTRKWKLFTRAVLAPSSQTSIKHLAIHQAEIMLSEVGAVASAMQSLTAQEVMGGTHRLQTVKFHCQGSHNETAVAIPHLLQQIGQNLEALSITIWLGSLTTESVISIQRACPNLRCLQLSGVQLESLALFLDAYEQSDCQMRSLMLHNVRVPSDSVTAFALALGDMGHTVSRVLEELCLDQVGQRASLDQANVDAFHKLLEAPDTINKLAYLDLRVTEPLLTQNRTRFEAHLNRRGTGVAALLPLACKTAFLSVCRRADSDDSSRSSISNRMDKLDRHVVSLIFQFAATRSWRIVRFEES